MQIDLNADLGEGGLFDQALLDLISSANISCGAHAGTAHSIRAAIKGAIANGVQIGAHPGYPDPQNFGRLPMTMPLVDLKRSLYGQLESLRDMAAAEGATLSHVKPHGALYNQTSTDAALAAELAALLRHFDADLAVVGLAGGRLVEEAGRIGMQVRAEGFVDRRYTAQGNLVPRSHPQALIRDPLEAVRQSLQLLTSGTIKALDGTVLELQVDTLCLHGDSPQALEFCRQLHQALTQAGITIQAAWQTVTHGAGGRYS